MSKKYVLFILYTCFFTIRGQDVQELIKERLSRAGMSTNEAEMIISEENMFDEMQEDQNIFLPEEENISKLNDLEKTIIDTMDSEKADLGLREETIEKIVDQKSDNMEKMIDEISIKDEYFGYDAFNQDADKINYAKFESIDPNYIIGPGDEIILMLWGETEINKKYRVSRDGYLFIPNLGQIFVNSLTLAKLEEKLFKQLKKIYSSLDPTNNNPTTFFDVSLGPSALRPVKIYVLGEVSKPGAYFVNSATTLFSSLYYFNGPKVEGSLRDVHLIRNQKKIASADIYQYLLTGIKKNDQQLQRNDVIFFPPRGKTVKVNGEIGRSKFFEMKDNETLKDLIYFAGGLKATTYRPRAQINRIVPFDELVDVNVNVKKVDINLNLVMSSSTKFNMYDGDVVEFFKINTKIENKVVISGDVNRPGSFALEKGMKLLDVLKKADGLTGDAYMENAEIVRSNRDSTKSFISVNLDSVLNKDPFNNINLLKNDVITIFNKTEMSYQTGVSISGHVLNPGIKPFLNDMTVFDLVFQGGGFKNKEHLQNTYLDRADLLLFDPKGRVNNIIPFRLDSVLVGVGLATRKISMGDEIRIYSNDDIYGVMPNSVEVSGFVMRPGTYKIPKSSLLSDLLFRVGGFDNVKHKNTVFLSRGDIIRQGVDGVTNKIFPVDLNQVLDSSNDYDPIILPGDKIIIHSKEMFYSIDQVQIDGIVNNPGTYQMKSDMTIIDLIIEAGGVPSTVKSFVVDISRISEGSSGKSILNNVSTDRLFIENDEDNFGSKKNRNNNYLIQPNDFVILREDPYYNEKFIEITGYVFYPGKYVIKNANEKVTDIIARAGGLRPEAYPAASVFTRNGEKVELSFNKIIKNPRSKYNFVVLDGDAISINTRSKIVKIEGEVNTPGNYQFLEGSNFDDYIKMAGGYTRNASEYNSFIKYPNGSSKQKKPFRFSPKVMDGSIITIASKEDIPPFSFTEYATNLTSIYSDFMQAYMMILLVGRQ